MILEYLIIYTLGVATPYIFVPILKRALKNWVETWEETKENAK